MTIRILLCDACIREASVLVNELKQELQFFGVSITKSIEEECEFCHFAEKRNESRKLTDEEFREAKRTNRMTALTITGYFVYPRRG